MQATTTQRRKFREIRTGFTSNGRPIRLVYRQYNGNEWGYSVASGNCLHANGTEAEMNAFFDGIKAPQNES